MIHPMGRGRRFIFEQVMLVWSWSETLSMPFGTGEDDYRSMNLIHLYRRLYLILTSLNLYVYRS